LGCWPRKFTKQVKAVPMRIEMTRVKMQESKSSFDDFRSGSDYAKLKTYDERENWNLYFQKAEEEIQHAQNLFDKDISVLLKKKKKEQIPQTQQLMEQIEIARNKAAEWMKKPQDRANLILFAMKNMDNFPAQINSERKMYELYYNQFVEDGTKAQKAFPQKKEDIDSKIAGLKKQFEDAKDANRIVLEECKKTNPDFAMMIDNVNKGTELNDAIKNNSIQLTVLVRQLYHTYTKTLVDMKVVEKPWVQLVTYRWSNYAEYDNTKVTNNEKRFLSESEAKQFEAQFQRNPEGFVVRRGSDYEIWAENFDFDEEFYHRYAVTEDGERTVGNWEIVAEGFYDENEDNLGMDIVSKPYGFYESESLRQAVPEGMALIGNKRCGRWVKDRSGNRYWEWYGKYMFYSRLLGGNRYYYNDWDNWHRGYRGRRAYYGNNDEVYGTYGRTVRTSSRFNKTNYARKTGFKTQSASVRGAGKSARGRGPGGGGK
jgi:hypothetical protein